SLQSGDSFWVGTRLERVSPLRFAFLQDIFRSPEDTLVLQGRVIGTALNERGRPKMPQKIAELMESSC
ncbi:MAG: acyl-CoA thioesterase, partial [Desulfuromonadales bacterium]